MALLPRSRRGTWLQFAVVWVACTPVFGWAAPPRPSIGFKAGGDSTYVIGFSPDGRLFASTDYAAWLGSVVGPVQLWELNSEKTTEPTATELPRSGILNHLSWHWADDPGRRWLFWQCATAEPSTSFSDLFPKGVLKARQLDPYWDPAKLRVSADGELFTCESSKEFEFVVRERRTGRVVTTLSAYSKPAFGPGPMELTCLVFADRNLTALTYDLKSQREISRSQHSRSTSGVPEIAADGRWWTVRHREGYFGMDAGEGLEIVDPRTGVERVKKIVVHDWQVAPNSDRLLTVRYGPERSQLTAEIWDLKTGRAKPIVTLGIGTLSRMHRLERMNTTSLMSIAAVSD